MILQTAAVEDPELDLSRPDLLGLPGRAEQVAVGPEI